MMLGSRLTIGLLCLWICLGSGLAAAVEEIERHSESGPVRVDLVIRPAEPVIGDVVELELEVRAEAGVEVLMPEFGEALGRFEIVDFAPSRQQDDSGGSLARQKYRLQPARSGVQTIPPLRIEFVDRRDGRSPAPQGEDAYEILTDRISLEIKPILAADAPLDALVAPSLLPYALTIVTNARCQNDICSKGFALYQAMKYSTA